jgi:serine protease Do
MVVPQVVPRSEMSVGQWAIAVGRTFPGEMPNLSVGVLSATNRIWGRAIQTDAKISPNNYGGPLVDIHGRVLGVLVPLSPQAQSEIAGAEWYDSGIGFAAPLADFLPQLEKLKQGEDLMPGILGVTFKGRDVYADKVEIAAVLPKSPAYKVGLQPEDLIVEAGGEKIDRQAQLKHVVGRLYAGETLNLVAMRGDQRLEFAAELTDKLEPYEVPFLGLLPMRDSAEEDGIAVRFVYPGSPADEAGMRAGDVLLALSDQPTATLADAQQRLANHEPGEALKVAFRRGDQRREVELTLGSLPVDLPGDLPPPRTARGSDDAERPAVGEVEISVLEVDTKCFAYVPETYRPDVPHGVLLWLGSPGEADREKVIGQWKDHCQDFDLILLAPESSNPERWLPTDVDFLRKTLDELLSRYAIDRTRIVACGHEAGGAMAYLLAFGHRDLIRGVAAADALVPTRATVPANDPIDRLAITMLVGKRSALAERMQQIADRLQQMKYPVMVWEHPGEGRDWSTPERGDLCRWIDTLDRL